LPFLKTLEFSGFSVKKAPQRALIKSAYFILQPTTLIAPAKFKPQIQKIARSQIYLFISPKTWLETYCSTSLGNRWQL
jgi:hypothetical protein